MTELVHDPESGQFAPSITLNQEQLAALGVGLPASGTTVNVSAVAVVTLSQTMDPDADGDVDFVNVTLTFRDLTLTLPEENAVVARDRKANLLYKVAERDVGGTPEKGEFGAFNRRFGM